jgi:hypothetical protein
MKKNLSKPQKSMLVKVSSSHVNAADVDKRTLNSLLKQGLVDQDYYGIVTLTSDGKGILWAMEDQETIESAKEQKIQDKAAKIKADMMPHVEYVPTSFILVGMIERENWDSIRTHAKRKKEQLETIDRMKRSREIKDQIFCYESIECYCEEIMQLLGIKTLDELLGYVEGLDAVEIAPVVEEVEEAEELKASEASATAEGLVTSMDQVVSIYKGPGRMRAKCEKIAKVFGIEVTLCTRKFMERRGSNVKGYTNGKTINVISFYDKDDLFVFLHELGHCLLHFDGKKRHKDMEEREANRFATDCLYGIYGDKIKQMYNLLFATHEISWPASDEEVKESETPAPFTEVVEEIQDLLKHDLLWLAQIKAIDAGLELSKLTATPAAPAEAVEESQEAAGDEQIKRFASTMHLNLQDIGRYSNGKYHKYDAVHGFSIEETKTVIEEPKEKKIANGTKGIIQPHAVLYSMNQFALSQPKPEPKYRIEDIKQCTYKGRPAKSFALYILDGDAYIFQGHYIAPPKTKKRDLVARTLDQQ